MRLKRFTESGNPMASRDKNLTGFLLFCENQNHKEPGTCANTGFVGVRLCFDVFFPRVLLDFLLEYGI